MFYRSFSDLLVNILKITNRSSCSITKREGWHQGIVIHETLTCATRAFTTELQKVMHLDLPPRPPQKNNYC